ncbi:MAG: UbiA family prenyltransferase [Deltaproteobacteria bacterium]|nr:UbiA family prenyltransferase [Deltaproteobacteria bacterium]
MTEIEHSPTRRAPSRRGREWLALFRASNLPTVWTNVAAALVLAQAPSAPRVWGLFLLSLSALYAGGACLNDFVDRDLDRRWRPDRPLPSGRVSPSAALSAAVSLLVVGVALLAAAPSRAGLVPASLLAAVIVAYDLLHDRSPWAVYLMASCRFLIFPTVALAATARLPAAALAGGLAQFGWVWLISRVARAEKERERQFSYPVIPWMIAGISLLDGLLLSVFATPAWFPLGLAGALLALGGQRFVRGD